MRWAATAAVFRPHGDDVELLFIARVRRAGDPWSGDVAFPGGLAHAEDVDVAATARRETLEEVGVELQAPLGQLSEHLVVLPGRVRPMRIVPMVFVVPPDTEIHPDPREVADAFWVSWRELRQMPVDRRKKRVLGLPLRFSGVDLSGRWLWGLTWRMVRDLMARWPAESASNSPLR
jgi:8-oxo-dGTP pyrophosphatase MutT (NUDIX family)